MAIIVLLATGTVVVPLAMQQNQLANAPRLTVLVDGKTAGKNITVKVDDTVYSCGKGTCALPGYSETQGSTFTIAQLTEQRELVWVIDATEVLKKFDQANLTIAVDSAQGTVTPVDSLQPAGGTTTEQPLTLANLGYNLNLQPDTIKLIGVLLVFAVIIVGLKFMSSGGAHH